LSAVNQLEARLAVAKT